MKQLKLIPVFIFITVLCFITLAVKAKVYSVNLQVYELGNEIERKEYRNRYLEYELKNLTSSAQVNKIARQQLQMKSPEPGLIVKLDEQARLTDKNLLALAQDRKLKPLF